MRIAIIFIIIAISHNAMAYGEVNQQSISVSLIALIANPEKWHGMQIRVIGVANLEFEGNQLCVSKEHLQYRVSKNCVWLSLSDALKEYEKSELTSYNGKYVLVEGVFDSSQHGHMGLFSGAINSVNRFMLWEAGWRNNGN